MTAFGEYAIDHLGEESNHGFTVRQLSVLSEKVCTYKCFTHLGIILDPSDSESSSSDSVPDSELE